jgi:hypothetical protein
MPTAEPLLNCRVCGYANDDPPWGEDGMSPSYDFCPCCGVEAGYGDGSPKGIRHHRERWLANGANWDSPECKPERWELNTQLKGVPGGID